MFTVGDGEMAESSAACEKCAASAKCECPAGSESCRAGRCECDQLACPCSKGSKREGRGCLGVAIPPRSPGAWLVAAIAAVLVIGVGGGLLCTRERGKDTDLPPVVATSATPARTASPTPSAAQVADVSDPALFESGVCTPVKATTTGAELPGSLIECIGVLYANLDEPGAKRASEKTGYVVTAGEYFALVGRTNGSPTQVGVGITPAGAPTNVGSPDAVDPIGRGGVTVAAFGESEGWSQWPLLDAANRFSKTGREIVGFRDGPKFTVLVPASEFGSDLAAAKLLIEAFKRQTADGQKPSDADPKSASFAIVSSLFRQSESRRDLFLLITPRVILEK